MVEATAEIAGTPPEAVEDRGSIKLLVYCPAPEGVGHSVMLVRERDAKKIADSGEAEGFEPGHPVQVLPGERHCIDPMSAQTSRKSGPGEERLEESVIEGDVMPDKDSFAEKPLDDGGNLGPGRGEPPPIRVGPVAGDLEGLFLGYVKVLGADQGVIVKVIILQDEVADSVGRDEPLTRPVEYDCDGDRFVDSGIQAGGLSIEKGFRATVQGISSRQGPFLETYLNLRG